MEEYRAAAVSAITSLGHEPIRAEDFSVSATSPQVTCLAGVRSADAIILLLGERYGPIQTSGLSATHEEYREAKERCPIFAFVQDGKNIAGAQRAFLDEVQSWNSGHYRGSFANADDLRSGIIKSIHHWELSRAVGSVDGNEMLQRAIALLPANRRQTHTNPALAVAITGGPLQSVLRPSELEDSSRHQVLLKSALFGEVPIFTVSQETKVVTEDHSLILKQQSHLFILDEQGSIVQIRSLPDKKGSLAYIIEEEVQNALATTLQFANWTLSYIDPVERLSHVAIAATLVDGGQFGWRTRREHEASPNAGTIRMSSGNDLIPVNLSPAYRPRAALRLEHERLAEDLLILLRRNYKS